MITMKLQFICVTFFLFVAALVDCFRRTHHFSFKMDRLAVHYPPRSSFNNNIVAPLSELKFEAGGKYYQSRATKVWSGNNDNEPKSERSGQQIAAVGFLVLSYIAYASLKSTVCVAGADAGVWAQWCMRMANWWEKSNPILIFKETNIETYLHLKWKK